MIRLYTPTLPARSGTADYADMVLRDLKRAGVPAEEIVIVVDDEQIDIAAAEAPHGYELVSYRALPNVLQPGETAIFFVANNEFHAYIHACMRDLVRHETSRVIAVIHEPCCSMLLNNLAFFRRYGFDDRWLEDNLAQQYGHAGWRFLEHFRQGELPELFEFITTALKHVLEQADEIWTHSAYAALKLALETSTPPEQLPKFRLVEHPEYDYEEVQSKGSPVRAERFVIGIFGWVAKPKRTLEVVNAYYRFLCRLEPKELSDTRLLVVGALPDPNYYDPVGLSESLGIRSWVDFYDYVDGETFKRLQARCSLLLNLRFPSCGETSGTMKHASQLGTAVLTTDYQAFRESGSSDLVSYLPGKEVESIAEAMMRQFRAWQSKTKAALPAPSWEFTGRPVHEAISELRERQRADA